MGAIANMLVQPYAALIIGSLAGLLSCYGYRVLQVMNTNEYYDTYYLRFFDIHPKHSEVS